jgi:hypothetical protein
MIHQYFLRTSLAFPRPARNGRTVPHPAVAVQEERGCAEPISVG